MNLGSHLILIKSLGKHQTSKSQHCLAQHLAQAEGSRSGETCSLRRASPSPRREHKGRSMSNAGSRLSEIPLAWASCLLAQKFKQVAWATFHAIDLGELPVSSRLGEIDSLGRDLQVSPLFFTVTAMYIEPTKHTKHLFTPKRRIYPCNQ
ncbi:hypothetical protein DEO72_LG9g3338 [Vigna unguiculata]|uniref:Uncharacterized protein n=1 Tax=Vigna unguiculata TaxID=3917 RepID=A0A4D6N8N4_VIGUN|nr:hypothetical protein DEO72_LG9g3336 [Vigna unguiculata]QCE08309.1 hypothetical protein DEO72_LG9g3338 [Vigna unguiculata]